MKSPRKPPSGWEVLARLNAMMEDGGIEHMTKLEAKALLVLLAHMSARDGTAYPSIERIARKMGTKVLQRARGALASLEAQGIIRTIEAGGGRNNTAVRELAYPIKERGTTAVPLSGEKTGTPDVPDAGQNHGKSGYARQHETSMPSGQNGYGGQGQTSTPSVPRTIEGTGERTAAEPAADAAAALAAPGPEKTDADLAMDLLAAEGIAGEAARQIVAMRGENAYDAVKSATARADQQPNLRNRSGWIITALRDRYSTPAKVQPANLDAPEQRRAKAVEEQTKRNSARTRAMADVQAKEQADMERLRALAPDTLARIEAEARKACPWAEEGDVVTNRWLRSLAIQELDRQGAPAGNNADFH